MGFPASRQPRLCAFRTWGSGTQICHFLQNFRPKTIRSLLQSFIV